MPENCKKIGGKIHAKLSEKIKGRNSKQNNMKTMSIIGIVLASLSFIFITMFDNAIDYEAGIGWGIIACGYLLAYSIVVLVKINKKD